MWTGSRLTNQVWRYMPAPSYHQPSIASASTRDGERVEIIAKLGEGRQVDGERSVAAPVACHDGAVEPDLAVRGDAVELKFQMATAVGGVELELPTVPRDAARAVSLREVGFFVERPFHRPVVGQVEFAPFRVVVIRRGRSPSFARPWRWSRTPRGP